MKLVPNARRAWRWYSTQLMTVAALLPGVWAQLPADLKASVPPETLPWVTSAVAIGALMGRLVQQEET